MKERAVAIIKLENLVHNLYEIKKCISDKTRIIAVVKANAYGHGAVPIAKKLAQNGVDYFGVAIYKEAVALRSAGIKENILILGYFEKEYNNEIVENDIIQTIFTYEDAKILSKTAIELNKIARIHIKIDTGMNRIGLKTSEAAVEEIIKITQLENIEVEGIFTHLACADICDKTVSNTQIKKFQELIKILEERGVDIQYKHVLNTAGAIDMGKEYSMDFVRIGIALYGLYPSKEIQVERVNLKPVMSLKTKLVHIKEIQSGERVSYGGKFVADKTVRVGTMTIGYADGYCRKLSNKDRVLICGKYAKVIGNICMDQTMVDLTDISEAIIGDEVLIFGSDGEEVMPIDEKAEIVGTINYEIICGISERVDRVYEGN